MKKISTFIIVFIIVLLLSLGVWWFVTKDTTPTTLPDGTQQEPRAFNPFGIFDDAPSTPTGTDTSTPGEQTDQATIQQKNFLTNVSEKPVAGATFITVTNGTSTETFIRYVERETGHIFDYSVTTGLTKRVSNTTIPRIREAIWGNYGSMVALRYLDDTGAIETFLGSIATTSDSSNESLLSGSFLPKNISTLSIHSTLPKTFYLMPNESGSIGYVLDKGVTKNVFSHPFSQWQALWSGVSSILLTTSASSQANGSSFMLSTATGGFGHIATSLPALTALPSKTGSSILFGSVGQVGMKLSVYDTISRQNETLPISALPEKCVWADDITMYCGISDTQTQMGLPDTWYQGVVSFSDQLWKIDTQTDLTTYVFDFSDYNESGADMTHLAMSANRGFLSFINKKDSQLWLVDFSVQPIE